jgi:hypothetical protein
MPRVRLLHSKNHERFEVPSSALFFHRPFALVPISTTFRVRSAKIESTEALLSGLYA